VVIYDNKGQAIKLTEDGIEINTPNILTVNAPQTIINGSVLINGSLATASGVSGGGGAVFAGGISISGSLDVTGQSTLLATTINGISQTGA